MPRLSMRVMPSKKGKLTFRDFDGVQLQNYRDFPGIQPPKIPRTSKTIYELPRQNLTESDLVKKSTSDRTKRRVAHVARYPRPVITKPEVPAKTVPQWKPNKKHDLKKFYSRIQPYSARRINETVALDSARAQHSQSTSSGVEDRVKADKKKLEDLDINEIIKKKQKKANVDKSKYKDVKQEKKSIPREGVEDRVKADKRKLEDLDCDEMIKKKQKKVNVDKSTNKDLKQEKKSLPCKGAEDRVKADKSNLVELDSDEVPKKGNFDKSKNKDVRQGKKSHSRKVDKRVNADKKKLGDLQDCDKVTKKKPKKKS